MIAIRQKNLIIIMLCCVGSIFVSSGQAGGYQCSPEPTDDLIQYGDTVTCNIGHIGDIDNFRFQGSEGDTVAVQVTSQSGGPPCVVLLDPDDIPIKEVFTIFSAARIDVTLGQTGIHSILVTKRNNDATMDYALSYQCNGVCPPLIKDVHPEHWAFDYIMAIYEAGITAGCSQNPL